MKKVLLAFLAFLFCAPITHGMITPAFFLVYPQQKTPLESLIELLDSAYYLEPSTYAWIKQQDSRAIAQTVDCFSKNSEYQATHAQEMARWPKFKETYSLPDDFCVL